MLYIVRDIIRNRSLLSADYVEVCDMIPTRISIKIYSLLHPFDDPRHSLGQDRIDQERRHMRGTQPRGTCWDAAGAACPRVDGRMWGRTSSTTSFHVRVSPPMRKKLHLSHNGGGGTVFEVRLACRTSTLDVTHCRGASTFRSFTKPTCVFSGVHACLQADTALMYVRWVSEIMNIRAQRVKENLPMKPTE